MLSRSVCELVTALNNMVMQVRQKEAQPRNVGIDVLRCFLMFCIVLHHCCVFTDSGHPLVQKFISACVDYKVDAFILISALFGVRFSLLKIVRFLEIALFASVVCFVFSYSVTGVWHFSYSLGWFGFSYVVLMCLSPIVNQGIDALVRQGLKPVILVWFAYLACIVLGWLPLERFGLYFKTLGTSGGNNFDTMLFVYITGRILFSLRVFGNKRACFWWTAFSCFMVADICWAILAGVTRGNETVNAFFVGTRGNNSPLVVLLSFALVQAMRKTVIPAAICRAASFLAPSMFSVYLIHEGTNSLVGRGFLSSVVMFFNAGGGGCCIGQCRFRFFHLYCH